MGDILSFYYGKFYKSDAHCKWKKSRKRRGQKFIHGRKIFSGPRNKILLSHLLPSIPTEVKENLIEAAKSFADGRSSLEEFVFTLKDTVGMDNFVEAVGIGKGKQDLTVTVLDKARSKRTIPRQSEIPVDKTFSSLTYGDIIKFLKGSRLSKAISDDLFWEAIWPRLLGRGWHSEQPKVLTFCGSKIPLVFLIPGINKFSRRKLTRGSDYSDSVRDVLDKVAMDPTLIKLDSEGVNEIDNYLRPKLLNSSRELFPIMDTSLFQGEVPFKMSALQSLPVDTVHTNTTSSSSGESNGTDSDDLLDSDVSPNNQQMSSTVISEYNKFDLSIPQFLPEFVASEPFCTDMDNFNQMEPSFSSETKYELDASTKVEQPTDNVWRKGTRNRMPTARALEAIASGFIGTKPKGRGMNNLPADDLATRPSRRLRRTIAVPGPADTCNVGFAGPIACSNNIGVKEEYNRTRD